MLPVCMIRSIYLIVEESKAIRCSLFGHSYYRLCMCEELYCEKSRSEVASVHQNAVQARMKRNRAARELLATDEFMET